MDYNKLFGQGGMEEANERSERLHKVNEAAEIIENDPALSVTVHSFVAIAAKVRDAAVEKGFDKDEAFELAHTFYTLMVEQGIGK